MTAYPDDSLQSLCSPWWVKETTPDFRRGRLSKSEAWEKLCADFGFTFTEPTTGPEGAKDYHDANPWRRAHKFSELGEPRYWRWCCPREVFLERLSKHVGAAIAQAQAAQVDTVGQRVTLWTRFKSLLWGNW
mgnify:CR=1 FL=1